MSGGGGSRKVLRQLLICHNMPQFDEYLAFIAVAYRREGISGRRPLTQNLCPPTDEKKMLNKYLDIFVVCLSILRGAKFEIQSTGDTYSMHLGLTL